MKRTFKNVKSIELNVIFKGDGCVNYEAESVKYALANNKLVRVDLNNSNYKFAKREIINDADGNASFKYKVSSECIGRAMFEKEIPAENPAISAVPQILYSALSNWAFIARGYVFTRRNRLAINKKSCVELGDAVEVGCSRNEAFIEIHSTKSSKDTAGDGDDAKSSTSLYNQESVGHLEYKSEGFINLGELQFIPDDPAYNRVSLDLFDESAEKRFYLDRMYKNFPDMEGAGFGYYYSKGAFSEDEYGERGLMLSKKAVDEIVHNILNAILDIRIFRRHSSFMTKSVTICVVTDEGTEVLELTKENLPEIEFEYSQKYMEADEDKIKANQALMEKFKQESKSKSSKKKSSKKSNDDESKCDE